MQRENSNLFLAHSIDFSVKLTQRYCGWVRDLSTLHCNCRVLIKNWAANLPTQLILQILIFILQAIDQILKLSICLVQLLNLMPGLIVILRVIHLVYFQL